MKKEEKSLTEADKRATFIAARTAMDCNSLFFITQNK